MRRRRIDTGVARPGRRPEISPDFPIHIYVGQDPNDTSLEVDGEVVGYVKKLAFTAELDIETGRTRQKLELILYDKRDQTLMVQTVDRLHEMTQAHPRFDLELDIQSIPGDQDVVGPPQ
jgi:hypothetical protein